MTLEICEGRGNGPSKSHGYLHPEHLLSETLAEPFVGGLQSTVGAAPRLD